MRGTLYMCLVCGHRFGVDAGGHLVTHYRGKTREKPFGERCAGSGNVPPDYRAPKDGHGIRPGDRVDAPTRSNLVVVTFSPDGQHAVCIPFQAEKPSNHPKRFIVPTDRLTPRPGPVLR